MQQQRWFVQGQPTSIRCPECRDHKLRWSKCQTCEKQMWFCTQCDQAYTYHRVRKIKFYSPHLHWPEK